jgi:hypothetical protein
MVKTPLKEKTTSEGVKHLYDLAPQEEGGKIDVKPYSEVFPFEWEKIAISFERLADRVSNALQDKKVGQEYAKLPQHMRDIAAIYKSKNIDPDSLYKEWQKLEHTTIELALEGCPIMLVLQGATDVAGDAKKVDVELRFGLITKEVREFVKDLEPFRQTAQELVSAQRPFLQEARVVPPLIANIQPLATGPNMFWTTRGQRGDEKIVAHNDSVIDVAITSAYPALQSIFHEVPSEEEFKQATTRDNALHEFGHNLAPNTDKAIKARIGTLNGSSSANKIIEELKADTGNMRILLNTVRGGKSDFDLSKQLYAKLGDISDYLKNKSSAPNTSGESYHFGGVAMISRLLDKGVIVEEQGKYKIINAEAGVEALAGINDEIMEIYLKGKPEDIQTYVAIIREKKNNPQIQRFVGLLKGK